MTGDRDRAYPRKRGRPYRLAPISRRRIRTTDVVITCPHGHPLLVDIPEHLIHDVGGERVVPEHVAGTWPSWCPECKSTDYFTKEAGELLVVKGERRDLPSRPDEARETE